ncbi:MAG TPA: glycosyltransferase family 2 protein [Burkholderiales bacterium]|nr:glycosyltransferase family 2 protein [Burkholderiales bacterium]
MTRLVSVVTACYNEQENIEPLYEGIREQFARLPQYAYEHIFIDNASSDASVERIKAICARDANVRLIVNTRNFGHIRSPVHALMQARGDAVIAMAADLQDPPELIPQFIERWETGFKVVAGVKPRSIDSPILAVVRWLYYDFIGRVSEVRLIRNFTGFGLYDREVVEAVRALDDPYPYFRGMVADLGHASAEVPYQPAPRRRGLSKNNFYTLYDLAMLGITSHSKVPLRMATIAGFALSGLSLLVALAYLVYKLVYWNQFSVGLAPLIIGVFFFASVQLFFIGILGEYIAAIHVQVHKRPLVIEKERVNFERDRG